ncbi:MAG: hypothetical protein KJ624_02250 [Chloroflexi bacterium]|nr:hypothetical protein [Chloroflexota bacterium]
MKLNDYCEGEKTGAGKAEAMTSQIQAHKNAALFYLGREEELEAIARKLSAENQRLRGQNKALAQENASLRREKEGWQKAIVEYRRQVETLRSTVRRWEVLVDKEVKDMSADEVAALTHRLHEVHLEKLQKEIGARVERYIG